MARGQVVRRGWVQITALALGMLVFLAHVITLQLTLFPDWLRVELRDLVAHALMMSAFALVYRLSFVGNARAANRLTLLVCCGWGAFCEILQYWHPLRDFNWWELSANILAPALVVALFSLWPEE